MARHSGFDTIQAPPSAKWRFGREQSGFTIVELLIVIVVIAILATISIVAYSGIQQRAKNARVAAGVQQYVKAIQGYYATNGSYPSYSGCLGANYPSNRCWLAQGNPHYSVSTNLDAQLSELVPNKPTLATELMDLGLISTNYYQRAGLVYIYTSASNIELRYYLEGLNQPCIGGFTFANEGSLSRCIMTLSN
jgi:prepilin-type N-terminal cleavage/methylation domain-containing protein